MNLFCNLMVTLSRLIDLTDKEFIHHGERVALLAWLMAEECLPERKEELFYAGLVHDVGANPAPHQMTGYSAGKIETIEAADRLHPIAGAKLIRKLPGQHAAADLVLEHHEQWDGSGYPNGKKGSEIDFAAQVLRIADCFDILLRQQSEGAPPPLDDFFLPGMVDHVFSSEHYHLFLQVMKGLDIYQEICDDGEMSKLFNEALEAGRWLVTPEYSQYLETFLHVFAEVIDSRRFYTSGHSERVSEYCRTLATALEVPAQMVRDLGYAALLHDAGMLAVPKEVLDSPGKLNSYEMGLVKAHPVRTMLIINQISELSHLALIAGYHHTRYDGNGYPSDLGGEDIPLLSRIMAVCDAFDAITSPRPYQMVRTSAEAKEILKEQAGTQFDPWLVQTALKIFR